MALHTPTLDVNLDALTANYQLLKGRHASKKLAAVVKADAYGLGMKAVSQHFWSIGCRQFYVATLDEAVRLRRMLPDARIGVFNGVMAGEEKRFMDKRIAPVLNDVGQIERWAAKTHFTHPAFLHVDSGMTRLGISQTELEDVLRRYPEMQTSLAGVMSHLACANDAAHPKNAEQLTRFRAARALLPKIPASFANSSGHFLPADYHFDYGRPGCALYGINPTDADNPMAHVATLSAPIIQTRTLERDETIGYSAMARLPKGGRMAVVALGYADGWPRLLSNKGHAYIEGIRVPVLGRISMDMIALDIDAVPEAQLTAKSCAEFINATQTVDVIAQRCQTIGYEIFTQLGSRIKRRYITE